MAYLKLGIGLRDRAYLGAALSETAKRVGIEVTPISTDSAPCVFTDVAAKDLAETNHPYFIGEKAFFSVTDRIGMQALEIPVLPTVLDPNELSGPIFVKHRRTYKARPTALCYTSWASAQEFLGTAGLVFDAYQKNPDSVVGELVAQPLLSYPTKDLDVCFSVNPDGEVLFFAVCKMRYIAPGKAASIVSCDLPDDICQRVRRLCKKLKISGGFHNADFVWFNNEWCLVDWNARLTFGIAQKHAGDVGFLDDALLHMCGGEVAQKPLMHFEQRGYWHQPVPLNQYGRIVAAGAFPRTNNNGIYSVSVTTDSPESARSVYDALGLAQPQLASLTTGEIK